MNKIYSYLLGASLVALPILGIANNQANNHKKNFVVYSYNKNTNPINEEVASDDSIILQIKNKINDEPILKTLKRDAIELTSNYGISVSGLVDSDIQAEKIITIIQSNKWVKDIDTDNLKVKNSKEPLNDTYITAKVKGALIRDNLLNLTKPGAISVETKNKIVYLSGSPLSKDRIDKIIATVRSVKGVNGVKNGIKISK